ncbi:hypothetical protein ACIP10_15270 [Streptomyces galbus]|uniref:hypothetical protein n=1 Tax=Streptomyces galbus TaxID=33898 RepID=UPI003787389E
MDAHSGVPALRPVADPAVVVTTAAERRLAAEHWLLSAARSRPRARIEWTNMGVAMLPLGGIFSAVRLPACLVLAASGERLAPAREVDAFLASALNGPVICDPHSRVYYCLVPGSMPRTWTAAASDWRTLAVAVLGTDVLLGVPRLDRTEFNPATYESYWAVPMESAGVLCAPLSVARLISAGVHALDQVEVESGA